MLEIGAGTGALTAALLRLGAEVTAFDLDPDMVEVLRSRDDLAGVDIRQADALAFDYAGWAGERDWRAAGNLPYNVGTPMLVQLASLAAAARADRRDDPEGRRGPAAGQARHRAVRQPHRRDRADDAGRARADRAAGRVLSAAGRRLDRSSCCAGWSGRRPRCATARASNRSCAARSRTAARRSRTRLMLALDLPRERIAAAIASLSLDPDVRGESLDLRTFAALADALDR